MSKEVVSTDRLKVEEQERWFDSPEYREARGNWITKAVVKDGDRFENSAEFRNARYLYRKRINGGGDGNE